MRPAPTVYLSTGTHSIISCEGVFAIFYDGKPFNSFYVSTKNDKYSRTVFVNSGYAKLMAKRHNERFKTDLFTVVQLA